MRPPVMRFDHILRGRRGLGTYDVILSTMTGGMLSNSPQKCATDSEVADLVKQIPGAVVTQQVPVESGGCGGSGPYQGCAYPPYPPGSSFPTCPYINGVNAADIVWLRQNAPSQADFQNGLATMFGTAAPAPPPAVPLSVSGGGAPSAPPPMTMQPGPIVSGVMSLPGESQPQPLSSLTSRQTNYPLTTPAVPAASVLGSPPPVPAGSLPAPSSCFTLFGESSCFGPVGSTTAIAAVAALALAFFLFGGKR